MKTIFFFVLLFFAFSVSVSQRININTTYNENCVKRGTKNYTFTTNQTDLFYFSILTFNIIPSSNEEGFIKTYFIYETSDNKRYSFISPNVGINTVYLHTNDVSSETTYSLYIECLSEECNYLIKSSYSHYINITGEEEDVYFHFLNTTYIELRYFFKENDEIIGLYSYRDSLFPYEISAFYKNINNHSTIEKISIQQITKREYGMIYYLNEKDSFQNRFINIFIYTSIKNPFMISPIKFRLIKEFKKSLNSIPISGLIRGIIDNTNVKKLCYNVIDYKNKGNILLYSESFTGGIKLSLGNDNVQYEELLLNNNSTLITKDNISDGTQLCITSLENKSFTFITKDLDINCFSIQLFTIDNKAFNFHYTINDGSYYQFIIPSGNILTLSSNKLNPTSTEFNVHIIKLQGQVMTKGFKCNYFKNCSITYESYSQLNDISKTIEINSQLMLYFSQENDLFNLNTISIFCENTETKYCIFITKITGNILESTETLIQTNFGYFVCGISYTNFYIQQNKQTEKYYLTIQDIYSIISPELKSNTYDMLSMVNKQIYTIDTNINDYFYFIPFPKGYNCYNFKISTSEEEMNTFSPDILNSVIIDEQPTKVIIKTYDGINNDLNSNENVFFTLTIQSNQCLFNVEIPSLRLTQNNIDLLQENISKNDQFQQGIEIKISNSDNYKCVVFIGLISNSGKKEFLLPDSQIFRFKLNKDSSKMNFYYILYNNNNTIKENQSFILNIQIPYQTKLNFLFKNNVDENMTKEITLTESQNIELGNEFYGKPNSYFKIFLEITLLTQEQESIIELLAYSSSKSPILINKNKYYKFKSTSSLNSLIIYNNNISLHESGKIIIGLPKNEADIRCFIFEKNKLYYPMFLGRIDLDLQLNYNEYSLEYSYNSNSFNYDNKHTQRCNDGCEIYIYYSHKYGSTKIDEIGVQIIEEGNKHIVPLETNIRSEFDIESKKKHLYFFTFEKDIDSFLIVFDTEISTIESFINGKENLKLTSQNKTLLYKNEDNLTLFNNTFNFTVSINTNIPKKSWYEFRIVPKIKNDLLQYPLYTLTYNDHTICSIDTTNQLCYIMIHTYRNANHFKLLTYFESFISSNNITAYVNIHNSSVIDLINSDKLVELFPNKTHFDKATTLNSNYLEITHNEFFPEQYAFITLFAKPTTDVKIFVSNIDYSGNVDISSSTYPLLLKFEKMKYYYPSILKLPTEKSFSSFEIKIIKHSITCEINYQTIETYRNFTIDKGSTIVRYNTFKNIYKNSFKQLDRFSAITNDSLGLIHQELFNINERIEKLVINEQKIMLIDSEHFPLFFISEINTNISYFDIYIKYMQVFRKVENITQSVPPLDVSVYQLNELTVNQRYIDYYTIIPKKFRLSSVLNFSTSDILLYRFKYNNTNNGNYIYIKISPSDKRTSIYDNSEIIIQMKSPDIQKPININRGQYYYDLYNIKNTNEQHYIINSGNFNSELIKLEISESFHEQNQYPSLNYTFYSVGDNNTLNPNEIKKYLINTESQRGKFIYLFNNENHTLPDILLKVQNNNKSNKDQYIVFNIKYTSFSENKQTFTLNKEPSSIFTFDPYLNLTILNNKIDIVFQSIKTHDMRIKQIYYELRVFKKKDFKNKETLKTNIPYDTSNQIKPIYQTRLFQQKNNKYVRHSIMLNDKAENFYFHLMHILKTSQEEESFECILFNILFLEKIIYL